MSFDSNLQMRKGAEPLHTPRVIHTLRFIPHIVASMTKKLLIFSRDKHSVKKMLSPDEINMQKARIKYSHQAGSLLLCSDQTRRQAVGGKPISTLPYVTKSYLSSDQLALSNVIKTDYIEKYLKITASVVLLTHDI